MLFLLFIACVFSTTAFERTDEIVNVVNKAGVSWVAEHNKFSSLSFQEKQKRASCLLGKPALRAATLKPLSTSYDLPTSFDSRKNWPNCKSIQHIQNQEHCGSCWAFAGTETLSDRFCIEKNIQVQLAPQDLISCDNSDMGCDGGQLGSEWAYMEASGAVTEDCMPYVSGNGTTTACPSTCVDGTPTSQNKYFAASYQHVGWFPWKRTEEIAKEISENGPVEVAFTVYEDFMQYKSGVYSHTTGSELGGHAVKAVGYGVTESGEDYWIVANSWGEDWGIDGYFWIKKGKNECGIESDVYSGKAGKSPA